MTTYDKTPAFNLKAVGQQIGVRPDTVRIWERRYGLPQPGRAPSGHRLYSEYDIEMVKWFVARQHEGLSISRAIKLWKQLEKAGKNPFEEMKSLNPVTIPIRTSSSNNSKLNELCRKWVTACCKFDEYQAETIISQAFATHPPEIVCIEVLQKGLSKIGKRWYLDKVSVQQEHFASSLATRHIERLIASTPRPTRPGLILIGCVPEEEHTFGPLLLTYLTRRQGWRVVYLGANIPVHQLDKTLTSIKPQLVIMSANLLHTAANLLDVAHFLQGQNLLLAYGGYVFTQLPELTTCIPGYYLGGNILDSIQKIEQLLTFPPLMPEIKVSSPAYRQALAHYQRQRVFIEVEAQLTMAKTNMVYQHLNIATKNLAQDIMAALKLGDLHYLNYSFNWLEKLLQNYKIPKEQLQNYLIAYHQSATEKLDSRGQPILDWLAETLEETLEETLDKTLDKTLEEEKSESETTEENEI